MICPKCGSAMELNFNLFVCDNCNPPKGQKRHKGMAYYIIDTEKKQNICNIKKCTVDGISFEYHEDDDTIHVRYSSDIHWIIPRPNRRYIIQVLDDPTRSFRINGNKDAKIGMTLNILIMMEKKLLTMFTGCHTTLFIDSSYFKSLRKFLTNLLN